MRAPNLVIINCVPLFAPRAASRAPADRHYTRCTEILKILLRDESLADDVDLKQLAKRTESFSGSDLKRQYCVHPPCARARRFQCR